MNQPFNQHRDEADVQAAMAIILCPHTDVDDDGHCLSCNWPPKPY